MHMHSQDVHLGLSFVLSQLSSRTEVDLQKTKVEKSSYF